MPSKKQGLIFEYPMRSFDSLNVVLPETLKKIVPFSVCEPFKVAPRGLLGSKKKNLSKSCQVFESTACSFIEKREFCGNYSFLNTSVSCNKTLFDSSNGLLLSTLSKKLAFDLLCNQRIFQLQVLQNGPKNQL